MYKSVILFKRATTLTADEFRAWFVGDHARNVIEVGAGRIRRYEVSFVVGPGQRDDWDPSSPPFEAVAEAWYDDRATCEQVWAELAAGGGELGRVIEHASERKAVVAEVVDLLALHPLGQESVPRN